MLAIDVNFLAVLVGALVNMIIGYVWYGPAFGKKWMTLAGIHADPMQENQSKGMGKSLTISFIFALIMSYVLYHAIFYTSGYIQEAGLAVGLKVSFWIWLGIAAPISLNKVLWESKKWSLFCIEAGCTLVSLLVVGGILSAWM